MATQRVMTMEVITNTTAVVAESGFFPSSVRVTFSRAEKKQHTNPWNSRLSIKMSITGCVVNASVQAIMTTRVVFQSGLMEPRVTTQVIMVEITKSSGRLWCWR